MLVVVSPELLTVTVVNESVMEDVTAATADVVDLGTATTTVATPPVPDGGLVTVFGAVIPSFVTVIVVKELNDGVGEPDETGTAIITVPVPPGVVGDCVIVLIAVNPPFVTVTVVYESVTEEAPGVGGPVEEDLGTATITVAVPPDVPGGFVTVLGPVNPSLVTVVVVKAL
jgi:hypothetical protein